MSAETRPINVLVVLGKNIGVNSTPEKIRRVEDHLSPDSRINAIAAADVANTKFTPDYVIFSTGYTAGFSVRSEAAGMDAFLYNNTTRFPTFPKSTCTIFEENSIDTMSNATEVAKIIQKIKNQEKRDVRTGLVSEKYHVGNAATIFRDAGIDIKDEDVFASDEVIAQRAKNPQKFLENYRKQKRISGFMGENMREFIRKVILHSGPLRPLGDFLISAITRRTRK